MMRNYKYFPLLLTYVLYPVVMLAARFSGVSIDRNWIDVIWLMLGVISLFIFVYKIPTQKYKKTSILLVSATLALLSILVIVKWTYHIDLTSLKIIPYMMEFKPIFYLFISVLLVVTFGKLESDEFVNYGRVLGGIVILDFIVESFLSGSIVLPHVSGERNYDACLLVIAYTVSLSHDKHVSRNSKLLIISGVILTLSRTAILASAAITFFASKLKLKIKIFIILIGVIGIISSFMIRGLPLDNIHSMDRYWMWEATFHLLINHPNKILTGFPVGESLPVTIPHDLAWLWKEQAEAWGLNGVYAYNMHAFWLRLTITWGVLGLSAILIFLLCGLFLKDKIIKGLCILVIVEGLTMGVFYLSNVSIPMLLAFMSFYNSDDSRNKITSSNKQN